MRPELLPVARYSLEAHLIKLEREGRACYEHGGWALDDPAHGPGAAPPSAHGSQAGEE